MASWFRRYGFTKTKWPQFQSDSEKMKFKSISTFFGNSSQIIITNVGMRQPLYQHQEIQFVLVDLQTMCVRSVEKKCAPFAVQENVFLPKVLSRMNCLPHRIHHVNCNVLHAGHAGKFLQPQMPCQLHQTICWPHHAKLRVE